MNKVICHNSSYEKECLLKTDILLNVVSLLRVSIEGSKDKPLGNSNVDWRRALDISREQGVASLVYDGLQRAYDNNPEIASSIDVDKSVKYDLFGQCLLVEKEYAEQWKYATEFADGLNERGIRTYVLKGFAISQLYPVPEHRPCSDMDCYLLKDQSPAYKEGNIVAAELGYRVDANYYKHSKIKVGSMIVESHQYCLPVKGDPHSKELNRFLVSIIDDGELRFIGDSKLLSPTPMFNAIYILAHAREHFFNEGITLRHICDWACLVRSLSGEGDAFWEEWKEHCSAFGLMAFGYSMSRLGKYVCGIEIPFECPEDNGVDEKVLTDVFREREKQKKGMARRVQLVRNLLSSRWKFQEFSDRSALGFTIRRVWGYLMERDPE